jgi:hypothetical protein
MDKLSLLLNLMMNQFLELVLELKILLIYIGIIKI